MTTIEQKPKVTVRRATVAERLIHRAKNVWHDFVDMTFEESIWILVGGAIFTSGMLGAWMLFKFGWFAGIVGAVMLWFIYMIVAEQYFFLALNRSAIKENKGEYMWPLKTKPTVTVKEAYNKLLPVKYKGVDVIAIEHHGKGYGPLPAGHSPDVFRIVLMKDSKEYKIMLPENELLQYSDGSKIKAEDWRPYQI